MTRWNDLLREYEARRFPPTRRLDLHAEGPLAARERTLKWIQSFAHEQPGTELLLVVERGGRAGRGTNPVRKAVEGLLEHLSGKLIEGWQPFGPGSIALVVSAEPTMRPLRPPPREPKGEGRTEETAGAALLAPEADIPPDLLPLARRAAELRRTREGLALSLLEVLLRRVWIDAQAAAMAEEIDFEAALLRIVRVEEARAYEEYDS